MSSFLEDAEESRRAADLLDIFGQQDQLIRDRIEYMVDRLEEVRGLKDDFAGLVEPMLSLVVAQPLLRSKLVETEAMLRREREHVSALTRQVADLTQGTIRLSDDLTDASSQIKKHEASLRDQESQIDELRSLYNERGLAISQLETQLAAEIERARAIQEANQALRDAAQQADQAVARSERDLVEARERIELLEHESESLRKSSGEQAQRIASLSGRQGELEHHLADARQLVSELEARLAAEQATRQKLESQLDSERAASEAQIATLEMKVEGLNARVTAADKIVTSLRDQLRDKNEALLASERSLTEVIIEKQTAERINASLQQEVDRQAARIAEIEKSRTELAERSDSLARAVSARDELVENAESRASKLADRIDQLTRRFSQERSDLEAANRALLEQLQNERSERALAQGALQMSRESRAKIQQQLSAMRLSRDLGEPFVSPPVDHQASGEDAGEASRPKASESH